MPRWKSRRRWTRRLPLKDQSVRITAKAGAAGRLFGSVTTKEVAEALERQFGFKVDKRKITMDDVKAYGSYPAEIKLHAGVSVKIIVTVTE